MGIFGVLWGFFGFVLFGVLFVLFLEWGLGVWVFCVCARVLCLGIFFVCCFVFFCGFLLLVGWLVGWVVSSLPRYVHK